MKIFRRPYLVSAKRCSEACPVLRAGTSAIGKGVRTPAAGGEAVSAERKCWSPLAEMRIPDRRGGRSEFVRSGAKLPDIVGSPARDRPPDRGDCAGKPIAAGGIRNRSRPVPDTAGGEDMLWDPERLFDLVILRERASQQVEVVRQSVEVGQRIGADRGVECCGAQAGAFGAAADRAADVT